MRIAIESSLPELRRWMWWAVDYSPEGTSQFLEESAGAWDSDRGWNFAISLRNEVIGGAGIDTYLPLRSSAELGYWLATAHTGQGLMTEAASALVTFAFEDLQLHRLQLQAAVENLASQRVAEKLGFRRMGRVREAVRGDRGFEDCYLYDLLESDPRRCR